MKRMIERYRGFDIWREYTGFRCSRSPAIYDTLAECHEAIDDYHDELENTPGYPPDDTPSIEWNGFNRPSEY